MTNPTPPTPPTPPKPPANDDALAALHRMGSNDPQTPDQPSPDQSSDSNGNGSGTLSASGFVSMLAKGQPPEPLDLGPEPPASVPSTLPTPKPVAVSDTPPFDDSLPSDLILSSQPADPNTLPSPEQPDREVLMSIPADPNAAVTIPTPATPSSPPAAPAAARRPLRRVPHWYRVITPVVFTMSSLLTLVGLWAIGASLYISKMWSVRIPLAPALPIAEPDGYIPPPDFWFYIPYLMLLCLPLAIALGLMGAIMARQINAADRTTPVR